MNQNSPAKSSTKPDRLSSLSNQSRISQKASLAYSRFIRILRLILPLLALGVITLLFLWPNMDQTIEPIITEQLALPDANTLQNELVKPRFESLDDDNQPFTITADSATQDPGNPDIVILENPTADLKQNDGTWLAGRAKSAIYEQKTEKLTLNGAVSIFHDAGYTFESEELRVNLNTQNVFSGQPVTLYGPEGRIEALGLENQTEGNIIIFKGPARLELTAASSSMNIEIPLP